MRQGIEPDEAIRRVLGKIINRDESNRKKQVAFVALRRDGITGAGAIKAGFDAAIFKGGSHKLEKIEALLS